MTHGKEKPYQATGFAEIEQALANQHWHPVIPVIDRGVRVLCTKPYPGHKHGCPNHGKRKTCPPFAPLLHEVLDLKQPVWAIWNAFDLGAHVRMMRKRHTKWTDAQCRCCLYWQGKARATLKRYIKFFLQFHPEHVVVWTPEACGCNVTETMKQAGITLEWPPIRVAFQVVLAGLPVNRL